MKILGIETSCDETSFALLEADARRLTLRTHVIASQAAIHKKYGGVVPEVAARKHAEVMQPLLARAIGKKTLQGVDSIAVTHGPGLITSLLVGVQAAKTLSLVLKKPLVGINHLEAHIYANWLTFPELHRHAARYFPSLVLIVSGGHTLFVLMRGHGKYELLGSTLDDAAGEAFDKVARLLKLGYPGGPAISSIAERGDAAAIAFPRPLAHAPGYDVSFSGLKTAVLYYVQKHPPAARRAVADVAASFQQAVVDTLVIKTRRAAAAYSPKSLMLVGGVSANRSLRSAFQGIAHDVGVPLFVPALEFTGDNGAMIAVTGYFRRRSASMRAWKTLTASAQLPLVLSKSGSGKKR